LDTFETLLNRDIK